MASDTSQDNDKERRHLSVDRVPAGGREISVRGLTRREVKAMTEMGLNPAALRMDQAEAAMDHVFGMVLGTDDIAFLEDVCNAESLAIYRRIMDLTYGRGEAEKNSPRSGAGQATRPD